MYPKLEFPYKDQLIPVNLKSLSSSRFKNLEISLERNADFIYENNSKKIIEK